LKKVSIVLLNWNNWADTLECLESLFQLKYPDFKVIVCDNGSTDGSVDKIRSWAKGESNCLAAKTFPAPGCEHVPKPLPLVEYDRETVETNDAVEPAGCRLVLIRNGGNLGFAGGINVGIRYLLASVVFDYCWILNNDTVVDPGALRALVRRMRENRQVGICGSTILEYSHPARVNAFGGSIYCKWLGLAWHIGRLRKWPKDVKRDQVEKRMSYVVGASMFVSRKFLEETGLMEESYFLYYEELDWTMRFRDRFTMAWAPDSLVYHKIGGSIGTSSHPLRKSTICDFYSMRNRIRFTRKYYRWALPTVYMGLCCAIVLRLLSGQRKRAQMVLRLMANSDVSFENACQD